MNREIAAFLRDVAAGEMGPALAERARTLLRPDPARRQRRKAKAAPRLATEAATKAERQAKSAAIRAAVFGRSGNRCEVPGCVLPPAEWHHIASGSSRKIEESEDSTCAICVPHHRLAQAGDRETLTALLAWAVGGAFRTAVRSLEHRIAKIDESRRAR